MMNGHHGCYLAVKIVSNILKKAQVRKFEKEWIQFIDFIVIIPFGIIILNYLCYFSDLQAAYDTDKAAGAFHKPANGTFHSTGWYNNVSDDGILAYKLLIQTGNVDNHEDKTQVNSVRLVNSEGIIYPPAFYNYLTAWVTNDGMAYSASMAYIHPETMSWSHDPFDYDTRSKWTFLYPFVYYHI